MFKHGGLVHQAIGLVIAFLDWPFRNLLVRGAPLAVHPVTLNCFLTSGRGECGMQKGKLGSSRIAAVATDPVADDAAECAKLWHVAASECGVDP